MADFGAEVSEANTKDQKVAQWSKEAAERPSLPKTHLFAEPNKGREKFNQDNNSKWKNRLLIAIAALGFGGGGIALHAKHSVDTQPSSPKAASTPSTLPNPNNSPNILVKAGDSIKQAATSEITRINNEPNSSFPAPDLESPKYILPEKLQDQLLDQLDKAIKDQNLEEYKQFINSLQDQLPDTQHTRAGEIIVDYQAGDDGVYLRTEPTADSTSSKKLSPHQKIDSPAVIVRNNPDGDWAVMKQKDGSKVYFAVNYTEPIPQEEKS